LRREPEGGEAVDGYHEEDGQGAGKGESAKKCKKARCGCCEETQAEGKGNYADGMKIVIL